jgi:hypothetical protein
LFAKGNAGEIGFDSLEDRNWCQPSIILPEKSVDLAEHVFGF